MYPLYTSGSGFYFIRDLGEIMKVLTTMLKYVTIIT